MLRPLLETLVLPPASPLVLLLLGTSLRRWRPRLGRSLQVLGVLLLLTLSLPAVGGALLRTLQTSPPLAATGGLPPADAIVVLSAEADRDGREFGHAVAGSMTMQRLRYGVFLHRRTNLPMLVSGGVPDDGTTSLAQMMADAANQEFHAPVRWVENSSADTWQNAVLSAAILKQAGVQRILLVTSAWHMPRAAFSFAVQGLDVVCAPTAFRDAVLGWKAFLPHWSGLRDSCLAMHEWLGRLVYWCRA